MANVTSASSSAMSSSPLLPSDINFEDIISANSIFSDSTADDTIVSSPTADISLAKDTDDAPELETTTTTRTPTTTAEQQSLQQKVVSLTKIVPKSTTPTTTSAKLVSTVKGPNPGQVVLIQGPSGPVPIRIANSATATVTKPAGTTTTTAGMSITSTKDSPTNKNAPVTIQVLKMSDGTLVQLKNNKTLNLTNLTNISHLNVGGGKPVIVKTTNGPKTVIGTQAKPGSGAPVLKSITLAEAQKAGFIKPKSLDLASVAKLQKMMPTSTASPTTAATTSASGSSPSVATKEVTIKSETDGSTKKIVVPQHMLKVQSASGNLQAIQIPGKPGVQYVRVVSSSGGSGTKVVVKKEPSPTKLQLTPKLIINSSGKISSSNASLESKPNLHLMSTVPTLRKIQDIPTSKLASTNQTDPNERTTAGGGTTQLLQIKKVNHTNLKSNAEPPVVLNAQIASGTYGKTASISLQPIIRKPLSMEQSHATTISDDSFRPKLYSTLKSPTQQHIRLKTTPEFTDEQIAAMFARRSPTPEALRRKHCNCTKSQCLKLYCDCFANGEFCQDCNCKECFNNLEYEEERQKAIKICLERNPNAFKPKITKAKDQSDLRLHNKGCNCKRSGCLKNYCECYEAKIACSSNCKCFGCRNVEDRSERERLDESAQAAANTSHVSERPRPPKRTHDEIVEKPSMSSSSTSARLQDSGQSSNKQPYNFITQDVVDATIQCMIAQADECKKNGMESEVAERMIIEEFGRCLVEIIDFSIRNMDN